MVNIGQNAPEFKDILGWINTDNSSLKDFSGKTIYLEFWDHTSLGCIRELSFSKKLWENYKTNGLMAIGVHSPDFEFERYMDNLQDAVDRYGIEYPVAQDNNNSTWVLYGNRYLPKRYVISSEGDILYEMIGQGDELKIENLIRSDLERTCNDLNPPIKKDFKKLPIFDQLSPETYMGSREIMKLKKFTSYALAHELIYNDPGDHEENKVYLEGLWKQYDEFIENEDSVVEYFVYKYNASKVFVVMSSYLESIKADVLMNGKYLEKGDAGDDIEWDNDGKSYVFVRFSGLYNLINKNKMQKQELKLIPREKGLQIYVISFE